MANLFLSLHIECMRACNWRSFVQAPKTAPAISWLALLRCPFLVLPSQSPSSLNIDACVRDTLQILLAKWEPGLVQRRMLDALIGHGAAASDLHQITNVYLSLVAYMGLRACVTLGSSKLYRVESSAAGRVWHT